MQFSLAGILLLTIVVAVSMAAVRTAMMQNDKPGYEHEFLIFSAFLAGLLSGPVVGVAIGVRRRRPIRGVIVGLVVGWIAAWLAVVLLFTPASLFVVAFGSVLLVGFGLAVRFFSQKLPND